MLEVSDKVSDLIFSPGRPPQIELVSKLQPAAAMAAAVATAVAVTTLTTAVAVALTAVVAMVAVRRQRQPLVVGN